MILPLLLLACACLPCSDEEPDSHAKPRARSYRDLFGACIEPLADVDGDGIADIAVSAPAQAQEAGRPQAAVHVFSGASGWPLYTVWVDRRPGGGGQLCSVPDFDADGVVDFVIAGRGLILYSGKAGTELTRLEWGGDPRQGIEIQAPLMQRVVVLGDLDQDGYPELLLSEGSHGAGDEGVVRACSLRTGEVIYEVRGEDGDWLGHSLARLGDLDGDGFPDWIAASPRANAPKLSTGRRPERVGVFSGRTGAVIRELTGASRGDCFGHSLAGLPDVTGDGVPDLLVGAPDNVPRWRKAAGGPGYVRLISGADGALVRHLDGDTVPDYGCSALNDTQGARSIGRVHVFSGKSGEELYSLVSPLAPEGR